MASKKKYNHPRGSKSRHIGRSQFGSKVKSDRRVANRTARQKARIACKNGETYNFKTLHPYT